MDLPLDWENAFNQDVRTQGIHADSISDGLIYSLSNLGRVDIEYISSITGEDYKTIICALKGSIYQNPETWGECFYKGWETSEEYLSGNMMRKWKSAKDANKEYNGYFADNIRAIEKVLPPTVATKDIYVTLVKLETLFDAARQQSDFGNGRYVRNILEQARMSQATRLMEADFDSITTEDVVTIKAEDITEPTAKPKEKRRIGFVA